MILLEKGHEFIEGGTINRGRILDENGVELDPQNIDYNHGHLVDEEIILVDQPYQEGEDGEGEWVVDRFLFDDGTTMEIEDWKTDPHVKAIDEDMGIFDYVDQGENNPYTEGNYDAYIKTIKEPISEIEPYQIKEAIRRYKPYTPEEQAAFDEHMAKETNKQIFLETGLERLTNTEDNVDDIMLLLAEMIGV